MALQDIVADGQLIVASLIAVLAGLISFASPCVLPLVPGYLAYVGGVTGDTQNRWRVVTGALLFVCGFTIVFVLMNAVAGGIGWWLFDYQDVIIRVMGVVVILMGLVFLGLFARMQGTKRLRMKPRIGLAGAPLLGFVFALGWAPCMGPTLGTIMTLSLTQGSMSRAVVLAVCYSLGLGLPFLLLALGLGWMASVTSFLKSHIRTVNIVGGALMILIGVVMLTGLWGALMSRLQVVIDGVLLPL